MSASTVYHTKAQLKALLKAGGATVPFLREQAERYRAAAKRNDGVEFDDARSRHKDNTAAKLFDQAADLAEQGNLTEETIESMSQY